MNNKGGFIAGYKDFFKVMFFTKADGRPWFESFDLGVLAAIMSLVFGGMGVLALVVMFYNWIGG